MKLPSFRSADSQTILIKRLICIAVPLCLVSFFIFRGLQGHLFSDPGHTAMVSITRALLLIIGVQLYILCMLYFDEFKKRVVSYLSKPAHPINLALFRILIFACMLQSSISFKPYIFASLPQELMYPPPGLIKISQFLPLNDQSIFICGVLFGTSAFLAMIGFCTRPAAWLATLAGIYFLGIPQLYGKVNHGHFIIWFAAILAASPCADVLSVDAALKRGKTKASPSTIYGLPIRVIYILFGIIYFFPGFWKLYWGGLDWFLSGNLIHQMHAKWFQLNGWTPFFRLDHYPLVCHIAAAMVVMFELSFIFLIFSERFRFLAAWGGIIFHTAVELFMNISFFPLNWCYMIFFDWHKIFTTCFKPRPPTGQTQDTASTTIFHPQQKPVLIVGAILIAGNIYCGVKSIDSWPFAIFPTFGDAMLESKETSLDIYLIDANGQDIKLDNKQASFILKSSSYWGLIKKLLREEDLDVRKKKLLALLKWLGQYDQRIHNAKGIKAYRNDYSTKPEDFGNAPIRQELIFSMRLK